MQKAVYAGSFDPITLGHEYVINVASSMFDLTVLVANNSMKKHVFNLQERLGMVYHALKEDQYYPSQNVNIDELPDDTLTTTYCVKNNIGFIIRGIRSLSDFDYEMTLSTINCEQAGVKTIFIPSPPKISHVSSTAVKIIAQHGGEISNYVSPCVLQKLKDKYEKKV